MRLVLAGLVVGALALLPVRGTHAAFTDDASVASGTLRAATLATPANVTCTTVGVLLTSVDIAWSTTSTNVAHRVEALSNGTWVTVGQAAPGATRINVTGTTMGSVLSLGLTYPARVVAHAGTQWTAASTPTFSLQTVSLIGLGLSVSCAALAPPA